MGSAQKGDDLRYRPTLVRDPDPHQGSSALPNPFLAAAPSSAISDTCSGLTLVGPSLPSLLASQPAQLHGGGVLGPVDLAAPVGGLAQDGSSHAGHVRRLP